ncbi:MAG: hypothetical protein HN712_18695 [Gemmatimonadetes bacterium]|jgi:hypothetical protein|nr:hypothetical protein [Gemmatimonadota bacterium]MBT6147553.1 hypothetical protein [Gemmatimonadota bacterium]MBT7862354.1 hypothetical protein [Gemmatimonadota bacterium]
MIRARRILQVMIVACLFALPTMVSGQAMSAAGAMMGAIEGDGYIIRIQTGNLVLIDLGQGDGVAAGDLFDIISAEVLRHPLRDTVLAVTPKAIGAVQVKQVYPRMSLALIIDLEAGTDPMLKPIARVRNSDRIEELSEAMTRRVFRVASQGVSLRTAVIPGIYQMQIGERTKGWSLLGLEAITLIGGFAYRSSSNDWLDQYNALDQTSLPTEFARFYNEAQDRRAMSNRFFQAAAALYIYNWVDVLWLGSAPRLAAAPPRTQVGITLADQGQPLIQLRRRF